nr:uncharacterized protein LOC112770046 [Arachis hypogaea]
MNQPSRTLALCTRVSSLKPFLPTPGSPAEAFFPASTDPAALFPKALTQQRRSLLPSDSEHGPSSVLPSSAEAFFPVPTEPPSTAQHSLAAPKPSSQQRFWPPTAQHSTDHRATQPPIQVRYGARASESVHPESWNLIWSVSSILTGLLSFMMDNSPTIGSVNTTTAEKQRLAKSYLSFNCKK